MPRRAASDRVGIVSIVFAVAVVLSWVVVSFVHTGSLRWVIYNQSLLRYGGVTAATLRDGEWWRLLTSQFVHVYLPHALLNAVALRIVGLQLERTIGAARLVLLFLVSGTAGQLVAVAAAPTVVATGASQAAIGMSIAAIILASTMTGKKSQVGLAAAACYLLIQACLDLLFAARIKTPHAISFAVGALAAAYWVWRRRQAMSECDRLRARGPDWR